MEHAAFEPSLSDEQLKELGRLVVNCGFVEFLLGFHVAMLFGTNHLARMALVSPLTTRRKTELLQARLHNIPKQETRSLVEQACKLIDPTIRGRNLLLHGIWGFDGEGSDAKSVVVSGKDTSGHRRPEEISKHADALAIASRQLKHAMTIDSRGELVDEAERLVIELA